MIFRLRRRIIALDRSPKSDCCQITPKYDTQEKISKSDTFVSSGNHCLESQQHYTRLKFSFETGIHSSFLSLHAFWQSLQRVHFGEVFLCKSVVEGNPFWHDNSHDNVNHLSVIVEFSNSWEDKSFKKEFLWLNSVGRSHFYCCEIIGA